MATQALDALLTATRFSCKPTGWPTGVGASAALVEAAGLPSFGMVDVYGRHFPAPTSDFQKADMPQHFILEGIEDRWLVDTQGYSYARYIALIG